MTSLLKEKLLRVKAPREITEIALNLLRFQTALKVKMVQIEGNKTWAEKGPRVKKILKITEDFFENCTGSSF